MGGWFAADDSHKGDDNHKDAKGQKGKDERRDHDEERGGRNGSEPPPSKKPRAAAPKRKRRKPTKAQLRELELERRAAARMHHNSRPFAQFMYQVIAERDHLMRHRLASPDAVHSVAYRNVRDAWVQRRIWPGGAGAAGPGAEGGPGTAGTGGGAAVAGAAIGGGWDPLPGLVWGHEKPLREFIADTRPWLPQLAVEGRAQRWTEEGVGTRELGTWEREALEAGELTWSSSDGLGAAAAAGLGAASHPSRDLPAAAAGVMREPAPPAASAAAAADGSVLADQGLLSVLLALRKPPHPPGLFGGCRVDAGGGADDDDDDATGEDTDCSSAAPPQRPVPPCWGLVEAPRTLNPGQALQKLDFATFAFPWDMSVGHAYYRDRRFKDALIDRLLSTSAFSFFSRRPSRPPDSDDSDEDSGEDSDDSGGPDADVRPTPPQEALEEAEVFYEREHARLTDRGRPAAEYHLSAADEDDLARRYAAYRACEAAYAARLAAWAARLRRIDDFAAFRFPPDVLVGRTHWADPRFRAAIMRRFPGLTDAEYEARRARCRDLLVGAPLLGEGRRRGGGEEADYRVSAEEEDYLQRRSEATRT